MGFIQADVCTDAMIVERSKKYETVSTRGFLQANGLYMCPCMCMYLYTVCMYSIVCMDSQKPITVCTPLHISLEDVVYFVKNEVLNKE